MGPNLVTDSDEKERCCVLDDAGIRCTNPAEFWVGANGIDDYTHVCTGHLESVKRPGDVVEKLSEVSQ